MAHHCHPAGLIAGARAIYTLTSLIGFEGLIWGRPVRCFAMPFYAGWGLTQDEMPAPARPRRPGSRICSTPPSSTCPAMPTR
jgi:capsular polysaccharide export protein